MTKDVLVSVKGVQLMDGTEDSIEIITAGTYYLKDGKHYILYEEAVEGADTITGNTVKANDGKVEVMKKGAVKARLVFEKGKKHLANYLTPIGLIVLGLTTTELSVTEEEDAVRVRIDYGLEVNGEFVSNCKMNISACSRQEGALNL